MIGSMIRSKKFYLVGFAFGLILISFACGMFFDEWLAGHGSFWPVDLLVAVLLIWFIRLARLI
jgi:hypothetical protein